MKSQHPLSSARGFSLIELIIIIVVMAIAAAGVITMNTGIFSGQADNARMETSTALMQECAERILSKKEQSGLSATDLASSSAATALCSSATVTVQGVTYGPPTVTVTDGNAGTSGMSACPFESADSTDCKLVTITLVDPPISLLLAKSKF